jgi:hypothetical protein
VATPGPSGGGTSPLALYIALFNAGDGEAKVGVSLPQAGLDPGSTLCARDLWARATLPGKLSGGGVFGAALPPHGAALFGLGPC